MDLVYVVGGDKTMEHSIKVMVETKSGKEELLKSKHLKIREIIMKFLFGDFCEVIVFNPSKQIKRIQVEEVKE